MSDTPRTANADLGALRIDRDRPKSGGGWIIGGVVLLVAVVGGAFAWQRMTPAKVVEVTAGTVRLVGPSDTGAVLSAGGYLLAERKANVSSKAFGRLEWLGVTTNSKVKKDEIIARLANADVTARLEELKADLKYRESEFARWKKAVDDGVEPREKLDRAENELILARKRVATLEAELEYTLIRAPFDGIVTKKYAEVGETVGPASGTGSGSSGGAIVTIIDPASIEMVADVNETNILKVREGQRCDVVPDAIPDRKIPGRVRQVVMSADRTKGVVQVKIELLEADARILAEMAARATFLREAAPAATRRVVAPPNSVRSADGRRVVYVIDGTKAKLVVVECGAEGEDGVEITRGLLGGEKVVTGGDAVSDGVEIKVK